MKNKCIEQNSDSDHLQPFNWSLIAVGLLLVLTTAWAYWDTIVSLLKEWQSNDDYSAGQLVPMVGVFFVWVERERLRKCVLRPCWWGILVVFAAVAARIFGLLFMYESAERYSLALIIAGLVLVVGGKQVVRVMWWALLFLFLMVPLPGKIHNMISGPLQSMATSGAVFLLEAFGVRVSQLGNVIVLNQKVSMSVVEACSGLRMLTAFVIVAGFIAYMVKRSRMQKAIIFLSGVPVAVICNILRLFVTGILFLTASTEVAEKFFHDFAGIVMMPVAVMLLFGELWLMDKLIVSE